MRHVPTLLVRCLAAALALSPTVALAGGVNIFWDDCVEDGGRSDRSFACTASTDTEYVVGSFILSHPMPDFAGIEIVVDIIVPDLLAQPVTLPEWWTFAPMSGACHGSSLSLSFDYGALANHSCLDPFGGIPVSGGLVNYTYNPNTYGFARVIGLGSVSVEDGIPLQAEVEYYAFRLGLKKDRATGADSCAGCSQPIGLWLNSVNAVGVTPGSIEVCGSAVIANCASWQPGGCFWRDAVKNATWGQVKALYR
jgi:hypothetical protein